jgi:hypothetical protein
MIAELETEFQTKIRRLPELLKELTEKPPLPTKEEICQKLLEYAELGDNIAKELYEEACK